MWHFLFWTTIAAVVFFTFAMGDGNATVWDGVKALIGG